MTCTMLPRLHLNHRAGAALQLGPGPNPLLVHAASSKGISGHHGSSPQEESLVCPRAQSPEWQPCRDALQGSMTITANGENNSARTVRPKSLFIRSGKTGQPLSAAFQ